MPSENYKSFIFNFSASYSGGGLKRLMEYSKWFNTYGGSTFIVNPKLAGLENKFPNNKYHLIKQSAIERLLNYSPKIKAIIKESSPCDLYYSYGIPISFRYGKKNWFHLSNVLPLMENTSLPLPLKRRIELKILGILTRINIKNADIISAESLASLKLFSTKINNKKFLSVNGSDDEINNYHDELNLGLDKKATKNIAVSIGTYSYKNMEDNYEIYKNLRKSNPTLSFIIIGPKETIQTNILNDPQVNPMGLISQSDVCALLKEAKYYITSTLVENSYNAASEGAFLAEESFLSDIPPHRELLAGLKFDLCNSVRTKLPILHVKKQDLDPRNLKTWDQVITEMLRVI